MTLKSIPFFDGNVVANLNNHYSVPRGSYLVGYYASWYVSSFDVDSTFQIICGVFDGQITLTPVLNEAYEFGLVVFPYIRSADNVPDGGEFFKFERRWFHWSGRIPIGGDYITEILYRLNSSPNKWRSIIVIDIPDTFKPSKIAEPK